MEISYFFGTIYDFYRLKADEEETTFGQGDAEETLLAYGDVQQNYFPLLSNKKHTICYTVVALHTVVCLLSRARRFLTAVCICALRCCGILCYN